MIRVKGKRKMIRVKGKKKLKIIINLKQNLRRKRQTIKTILI